MCVLSFFFFLFSFFSFSLSRQLTLSLTLSLTQTGTVGTLRESCSRLVKISKDSLGLVLIRGTKATILSTDALSLHSNHHIRDGDEIRVELLLSKEKSRVMSIFDTVTNCIRLKLFVRGNEKRMEEDIEVDRRVKLKQLREILSKKLNVHSDTFQIRREVRGPELKNGEKSLASYLFRNGGCVFADLGKPPTKLGFFSVIVSVLKSDDQKSFTENIRKVRCGDDTSFLEIVDVLTKEKEEKEEETKKKKKKERMGVECTRDSTCRCEMCLNSAKDIPEIVKASMNSKKMSDARRDKIVKKSMMTERLGSIFVQKTMTNAELKHVIFNTFSSKLEKKHLTEKSIRLRGQGNDKKRLTRVYFDNRTRGSYERKRNDHFFIYFFSVFFSYSNFHSLIHSLTRALRIRRYAR